MIINDVGSSAGFVKEAKDVFISKTDSIDYHSAMNQQHYVDWFKKLIDLLPDKSVVVLDQAPYHKERVIDSKMFYLCSFL